MNTDSPFNNRFPPQIPKNITNGMAKYTNESTGTKDMENLNFRQHNEADRFELLSAYLDGEVTAAERKQVEQWLVTDESVKSLYARLLKLRQGVKTMPVPALEQSPEATFQAVWKQVSYRYQLSWIFGGAALAACIIGSISGLIPGNTSKWQLAEQKIQPITTKTQPVFPNSPLMVALNNPPIEIPKTAVASPRKPVSESKTFKKDSELNIN